MAKFIESPTVIAPAGNLPKEIKEFIGVVNSGNTDVSIAKMKSPAGWEEPPQTPEFDEYTIVLSGQVKVKTATETFEVNAGQAFIAHKNETVQYSTPQGAEYIAVCLPAFSPDTVNRKDEE